MFEWPYYTLLNRKLFHEDGHRVFYDAPFFSDVQEAEDWLIAQDERGTVVDRNVQPPSLTPATPRR